MKRKTTSLILTALLAASTVLLNSCAESTDIRLSSKTYTPTRAENIAVFSSPPKKQYEELALLESSSDVILSGQAATNRAILELKAKAATYGANAILIKDLRSTQQVASSSIESGSSSLSFGDEKKSIKATAIRVK